MKTVRHLVIALSALLAFSGCKKAGKGASGTAGGSGGGAVSGTAKSKAGTGGATTSGSGGATTNSAAKGPDDNSDVASQLKGPTDPARMPKAPDTPPAEVAARVIVVKYITANDPGDAKRNKDAASKRAALLAKLARQKDSDFVALAKKYSDAGEAPDRVYKIGPDSKLPFAKVAMALGEGQVSHPLGTRYGYYIVMRDKPQEVSTAHIQLVYKGAELAPVAFKRSKEDAKKLAQKVLAKALKGGNFSVLAATYSDSPSKMRGGVIRPLSEERLKKYAKGFDAYYKAALATEVSSAIHAWWAPLTKVQPIPNRKEPRAIAQKTGTSAARMNDAPMTK